MKKRIFICYRRATSSYFVERLVEKLRLNNKFDVYYDQNPKHKGSGGLWDLLKEDIDNSTHFVLVVDEKTFQFNGSIEEDMVWKEIDHALKKFEKNKKFKIIPISINGNEIPPKEFLKKYGIENFDKYTFIKADYNDSDGFDSFYSDFIKEKLEYDEPKEEKKKRIWQSILAILGAAFCVFGGTLLQQYITSKAPKIQEPPKLVFAGGGSVANMIKMITGDSVDVERYKNAFYLNMPSENAWILMSEEVMTSHTSDSVQNKFYPVCLSALKAEKEDFLTTVKEKDFINEGTIISYKLPYEDTLLVYIDSIHEKKLYNHLPPKDRIIPIGKLNSNIIEWCKDDSFKIYITRERSGTYHIYQKKFPQLFNDSVFRKKHVTYYDKKLTKAALENEGNKYIVLSSKYYTPEGIRELDSLMIVSAGDTLSKPMYIYFAGRKYISDNQKDIRLTIPGVMVSFFKSIAPKMAIDTVMIRNNTWKVITPLESLKIYKPKPNTKPTKSK